MGRPPRARRPIQQRGRRGGNGEILAVRGALEIAAGASERPGDHPPHLHRVQMRRKVGAQLQQTIQPERLFMRGDLEHAVGRGIADRPAGPQMRLAMLGDDRHARGMAIAQNPFRSGKLADDLYKIVGKGGHGIGEIMPVPWHRHPGQLPMTRGRILAPADLGRSAPAATCTIVQTGRVKAGGQPDRLFQPQRTKVRHPQRAAAPLLRPPLGAGLRDMAQRVRPGIAKGLGVGRATAADGIHHDQKGTRHLRQSFSEQAAALPQAGPRGDRRPAQPRRRRRPDRRWRHEPWPKDRPARSHRPSPPDRKDRPRG